MYPVKAIETEAPARRWRKKYPWDECALGEGFEVPVPSAAEGKALIRRLQVVLGGRNFKAAEKGEPKVRFDFWVQEGETMSHGGPVATYTVVAKRRE